MESSRSIAAPWKRILLAVATAVLGFAALGTWAIASPVGAAPDDDFHLASIWCSWGDREGLCAPGDAANERTVPVEVLAWSECYAQKTEKSADCNIDETATVSTDRGNFVGAYPPVFYVVMGTFASPNVVVSTIVMRLFNAALFVGAVSALLALLRPGQRGPLVWGAVATMVPLGVFIVSSVNPSSWAILAGLTVWLAVYGFLTSETRGRSIALGAIAVALGIMGAGARGDSAAYVAIAAVAASILTFEKSRAWLKRAALPLGLAVIGGIFFLASRQSSGIAEAGIAAASSGDAASSTAAVAEAPSKTAMLLTNLMDLPWLWTGGTGTWGLGWYDTPVPPAVWVLMIGLLFALLLWGLRVMTLRKGAVMLLALAALTVLPLYVLYGKGLRVGEWVQPRYLLPLLILFMGLALYGFARDNLGLTRLQAGVIFAVLAVCNSLSLHNNMRRYITGLGDGGFNLNANIEWWWSMPISPMVVWFLGSAAFALALAGLFLIFYPKGERPQMPLEERAAAPSLAA